MNDTVLPSRGASRNSFAERTTLVPDEMDLDSAGDGSDNQTIGVMSKRYHWVKILGERDECTSVPCAAGLDSGQRRVRSPITAAQR